VIQTYNVEMVGIQKEERKREKGKERRKETLEKIRSLYSNSDNARNSIQVLLLQLSLMNLPPALSMFDILLHYMVYIIWSLLYVAKTGRP
jgi:hypothetical protein